MVNFTVYDTEKGEGVEEYFELEEGGFFDAMYIYSIDRRVYNRLSFSPNELIKDLFNNMDINQEEFLLHIKNLINV